MVKWLCVAGNEGNRAYLHSTCQIIPSVLRHRLLRVRGRLALLLVHQATPLPQFAYSICSLSCCLPLNTKQASVSSASVNGPSAGVNGSRMEVNG